MKPSIGEKSVAAVTEKIFRIFNLLKRVFSRYKDKRQSALQSQQRNPSIAD